MDGGGQFARGVFAKAAAAAGGGAERERTQVRRGLRDAREGRLCGLKARPWVEAARTPTKVPYLYFLSGIRGKPLVGNKNVK